MQTVRLWTAALVSRIDGMVSRIENHEALAASAIRDVRRAAARAGVQLRRVRADGDRLRAQLEETREAEASWRERARRKADEDEAMAVECLRRARESARRLRALERRLAEHERIERDLGADVTRIQERLTRLEEHRHVLAARESRAVALAGVHEGEDALSPDVDDLFDRWEIRISERELVGGRDDSADSFEDTLSREEEEADLRAELDALRRQ